MNMEMNMRTMRGLGVLSLVALQAGAGELQVAPDGLSPHAALETIRAAKAKGDASAWTVKAACCMRRTVFFPLPSGVGRENCVREICSGS